MVVITHKYLKSISTSDYKKLMDTIKDLMITDSTKALSLFDVFLAKLKEDEEYLKNGEYDKISDCALFAPRHGTKLNSGDNPIRLAYYGANKYFIETGFPTSLSEFTPGSVYPSVDLYQAM